MNVRLQQELEGHQTHDQQWTDKNIDLISQVALLSAQLQQQQVPDAIAGSSAVEQELAHTIMAGGVAVCCCIVLLQCAVAFCCCTVLLRCFAVLPCAVQSRSLRATPRQALLHCAFGGCCCTVLLHCVVVMQCAALEQRSLRTP